MNFLSKFVRPFGTFLIIAISFFLIFLNAIVRDSGDAFSQLTAVTNFMENRFYDHRMINYLDPSYQDPNIILVKIDDYSLRNINSWPIPRQYHAQMIQKLQHFGAKVIALDILFPEKSPVCGEESPDTVLAEAMKEYKQSGGQLFLTYNLSEYQEDSMQEIPDQLWNFIVDTKISGGANFSIQHISQSNFPIDELVNTDSGLAFISMQEDLDGIFRYYRLLANIDELYFGSLGLHTFEAFTEKKIKVEILPDNSGRIEFGQKALEVNSRGETKIRFLGAERQYQDVSLYDLIQADPNDEKMKDLINGKIVYVGSTATGAHDLRPTPLSAKTPGVYVHMNITSMLLNEFFYQSSDESIQYSLIFLAIGIILMIATQFLGSAFLDLFIIAFLVGGSYAADYYYFLPEGYQLKLFYCYMCFGLIYIWNTLISFAKASKEKKQVKGTFSRYVSPAIVNEMLDHPEKLTVGGEKRDITCLFSDVRDFTSISEMLTPNELSKALNHYMGKMTDIVFETHGTLDKYIGDAIVAFWGAPLALPDHPQQALNGAIQMIEALPAINEDFKAQGLPEFKVGLGLNSGECSVGNMGSSRIFSYTALGDNMNLGARLEGLCKFYGAQIIISENTFKRVDLTGIKYRQLDKVTVKGKTRPVDIYEIIHKHHLIFKDDDAQELYNLGYQAFCEKDLSKASECFKQILIAFPEDKPSVRVMGIIEKYLKEGIPETDHDVTKMTEK